MLKGLAQIAIGEDRYLDLFQVVYIVDFLMLLRHNVECRVNSSFHSTIEVHVPIAGTCWLSNSS